MSNALRKLARGAEQWKRDPKAKRSTKPDSEKGPARSPTQREQWAMRRAAAALAAEEAAAKAKKEAA